MGKLSEKSVVVTGAGGFCGHFVREFLLRQGHNVQVVDTKPFAEGFECFPEADNRQFDLRDKAACWEAAEGANGGA